MVLGVPHDFEWYGHGGDARFARLQWGSQVFQHVVFEDFKIDVSFPQTIECDASDFTVLFTFVGLVPVKCTVLPRDRLIVYQRT